LTALKTDAMGREVALDGGRRVGGRESGVWPAMCVWFMRRQDALSDLRSAPRGGRDERVQPVPAWNLLQRDRWILRPGDRGGAGFKSVVGGGFVGSL
jgi:hypothetical protein